MYRVSMSTSLIAANRTLEYKASRPLAVGINALALINARTFRDEDEVALTELVLRATLDAGGRLVAIRYCRPAERVC